MGIPLHSRLQGVAPGWCAPFIGLPYERGARGPDLWDCWGLLGLVLKKQFGLIVPAYEGVSWKGRDRASHDLVTGVVESESAARWAPVALDSMSEQPGDAIVLRIMGHPLHVGVVAAPGWMLHASEDAESALERYDGLCWHNRVQAFWRFAA
jgi:cell wall-associated NlpC family hydrolase